MDRGNIAWLTWQAQEIDEKIRQQNDLLERHANGDDTTAARAAEETLARLQEARRGVLFNRELAVQNVEIAELGKALREETGLLAALRNGNRPELTELVEQEISWLQSELETSAQTRQQHLQSNPELAGELAAESSPGDHELQARTADLADAEARYHATLDEPAASEADRIDAAENLDRAQDFVRELTPEADPTAEAQADRARDTAEAAEEEITIYNLTHGSDPLTRDQALAFLMPSDGPGGERDRELERTGLVEFDPPLVSPDQAETEREATI